MVSGMAPHQLKCNSKTRSGRAAYSLVLIGCFLTWVPHTWALFAVLVRLNASGSSPLAQVWMGVGSFSLMPNRLYYLSPVASLPPPAPSLSLVPQRRRRCRSRRPSLLLLFADTRPSSVSSPWSFYPILPRSPGAHLLRVFVLSLLLLPPLRSHGSQPAFRRC